MKRGEARPFCPDGREAAFGGSGLFLNRNLVGGAADGFFVEVPEFEVGSLFLGGYENFGGFEGGLMGELELDFIEVGEVVGGEVDMATGFHGLDESLHEPFVHDAVAMVAFFGPGIGEEDVAGVDAARGEEVGDGIIAFHAEEADVFEGGAEEAVVDLADAFEHTVDAKELDPGEPGGAGEQEAALPAAEVDLDGLGWVEPLLKGKRIEPVVGENAVGCGGGGHGAFTVTG